MNKNHPNLLAWCIGAFLLSSAIPFAGFALIPIYMVIEHRRRAEAARLAHLSYKYAFEAYANARARNGESS